MKSTTPTVQIAAATLCLALGACGAATASNAQIGTVTGIVLGGLGASAATGSMAAGVAGAIFGGVIGHEIGRRSN